MTCFKQTTLSTMTKRSVRFDREVLTAGLIESFPDQQTTLWYSQSDFKRFRKENPNNFIEPNPCRQRLVKSILKQQWEHQKLGMSDPKGLQQLSRACSKDARERAHALANANACDVNGTVPDSAARRRSPTRNVIKFSVSPIPRRVLPKVVCLSALSAWLLTMTIQNWVSWEVKLWPLKTSQCWCDYPDYIWRLLWLREWINASAFKQSLLSQKVLE